MTDNKSTRPTSNIFKNTSHTEDKTTSARPQSNINPNIKVINESEQCFDFITSVRVCDEDSTQSHNNKK